MLSFSSLHNVVRSAAFISCVSVVGFPEMSDLLEMLTFSKCRVSLCCTTSNVVFSFVACVFSCRFSRNVDTRNLVFLKCCVSRRRTTSYVVLRPLCPSSPLFSGVGFRNVDFLENVYFTLEMLTFQNVQCLVASQRRTLCSPSSPRSFISCVVPLSVFPKCSLFFADVDCLEMLVLSDR